MTLEDFCGVFQKIQLCRLLSAPTWEANHILSEWTGKTAGGQRSPCVMLR